MEERRPSPEAMLRRAEEEADRKRRGRLKIFFGAAPGVGKTYAMLEAARALRARGGEVVVGWIEPHGRSETEALAEGMERVPPRAIEHRGIRLAELDLDAALARRPTLLLADELAHTNAPGARHAKRWQDVQELIEAGISVWTTLNVQHLESVSDVVAQITGVRIQETVPDSVVDGADEIEFVDLPPDDLLRRLQEGKVYVPEQAAKAVESYFRKGNLIALRELALRRAAERVDRQTLEWRREHGIRAPWPTAERILVAVGPAPQSANLVRAACRMANRLRAPWIALSVERPPPGDPSPEDRERVADHLELAERLGGETVVLRGERVAEEILGVARERNVTRIVVGKPTRPRWLDLLRGSVVAQLVRGAEGMDVLVTTGVQADVVRPTRPPSPGARPADYLLAAGTVAACTGLGVLLGAALPVAGENVLADQAMLYLAGILFVALRVSEGPALAAAILSVAALNFFFVPPRYTFTVEDASHVLTFLVMLVVGVTVSRLTVRIRQQAAAAEHRERRTAALYALTRELGPTTQPIEIAGIASRHARELMQCECRILLAGPGGTLPPRTGLEASFRQPERELAVARWALEHGHPAGHGTDTLPGSEALWIPLAGSRGVLGVAGILLSGRPASPTPAQRQLLETLLAHATTALDRALLAEEASRSRGVAEAERARSTLLAAVSHDLRTPLASIAGSAEVLLASPAADGDPGRRDLLQSVRDEARRLADLVGDLLELTRLSSGAVRPHLQWIPLEEAVDSALDALDARLAGYEVRTDLPAGVPLLHGDPVLLERILVNLLENARKFAPPGGTIEIAARMEDGAAEIEVRDRGPGIPAGEEERIFDRFYRAARDAGAAGHGLGLSICRAAAELLGGSVRAENRPGGGAVFRVRLPLPGPPPAPAGGSP
jgi:two-component system sensor histidine kinase KdpD